MIDDFGGTSDHEKECMEKQLPDYFSRKLGSELIAFIARDDKQIVSVAYLHIIEMPANSMLLNGLFYSKRKNICLFSLFWNVCIWGTWKTI